MAEGLNAIATVPSIIVPKMVPVASRHRALLQLGESAPLYLLSSTMDLSVDSIVSSTMTAKPILDVDFIGTGYRREVNEAMAELEITFYQENVIEKKHTIRVTIPRWWSPQMYVGAVSMSLQKHSIIAVDSVLLEGTNTNVFSVNEIHWLFVSTANQVSDLLNGHCSFLEICGGSVM